MMRNTLNFLLAWDLQKSNFLRFLLCVISLAPPLFFSGSGFAREKSHSLSCEIANDLGAREITRLIHLAEFTGVITPATFVESPHELHLLFTGTNDERRAPEYEFFVSNAIEADPGVQFSVLDQFQSNSLSIAVIFDDNINDQYLHLEKSISKYFDDDFIVQNRLDQFDGLTDNAFCGAEVYSNNIDYTFALITIRPDREEFNREECFVDEYLAISGWKNDPHNIASFYDFIVKNYGKDRVIDYVRALVELRKSVAPVIGQPANLTSQKSQEFIEQCN